MASKKRDIVTMNVSLPGALKKYVDSKVASGRYGSVSEVVREAIREKQVKEEELAEAKRTLADRVVKSLNSGKPKRFTKSHFDAQKARLIEKFGAKKTGT